MFVDRLDLFIKEKYGFSREYSKEIIQKGYVKINEKIILKPAFKINSNDLIEINKEAIPKYVSRGGLKLEKALDFFNINLKNKVCLDIGSSTGGFTDCMLQNGAFKIYAVDTGTNQLDEKLLQNEKVISMENTDIRELNILPEKIDFITIDVSFISLTKVLNSTFNLLKDTGEIIALIKPQFEAGAKNINKNGIVKDKKVHKKILEDIHFFAKGIGYCALGLTFSPIVGKKGNIEYLIYLKRSIKNEDIDYKKIVEEAFAKLK